jgi:hypothetical protein
MQDRDTVIAAEILVMLSREAWEIEEAENERDYLSNED